LRHILAGDNPAVELFRLARTELGLLFENRFADPNVVDIDVRLRFRPGREQAWLFSATPDRRTVRPGETLRVALRLRDYRGRDSTHVATVAIPPAAPAGRLSIVIGPADSLLGLEMNRAPGRFRPQSLDALIALLEQAGNEDRLRIIGISSSPGLTLSGQELPSSPPSLRHVLLATAADRRLEPTLASRVLEQLSSKWR